MDKNTILQIPVPNTNRDSHLDLRLIGRGRSPQISKFNGPRGKSPKPTHERPVAGDNSTQDGASKTKETNVSIGERDGSSGFPQAIGEEQERGRVNHDTPWKTYEKGYDLKLDQFVMVATRKPPLHGKVAIKAFPGRDAIHKLGMLHTVCHERFVKLLEIFEYGKTFYAVFEHIATSLTQVVNAPAYPSERQLAAIVGQVGRNRGSVTYVIADECRF